MTLGTNDDDMIGRIPTGEKSFILLDAQNYQEARFCDMKMLRHLIFQVFK
jgi:hypothetical protein